MDRTNIFISFSYYRAQQVFHGDVVYEEMPWPETRNAIEHIKNNIGNTFDLPPSSIALTNIIDLKRSDDTKLRWPIE